MSKPRIPNQRKANLAHKKRVEQYAALIQQVYDKMSREAAQLVSLTDADPYKPFSFADYPLTKEAIIKLKSQLMNDVSGIIMSGTSAEWKECNLVQDLVAKKVLSAYTGTNKRGDEYKRYFQTNPDALKAFQQRKDEGMNLSSRMWHLSEQYKGELEEAITAAIAPGTSAMELAAQVKQYLKYPDKRFRRIKEKMEDGKFKWHLSKPAKAYHPGQGVYRSSARNAQRLARTEINMAYRTAEQERWKQFDFVVGYEVKTTQNGHHIEDICDQLKGKYPKDFVFKGWHPQCMCYCIPILKTEDEFWNYDPENPEKSVNEITELPSNFREWIDNNRDRIESAETRGKLPYFIRDNRGEVDKILHPELYKKTPLEIASARHALRTKEDVYRIRENWGYRKIDMLWEAIANGDLPYECLGKLKELKDYIVLGDFDEFYRQTTMLETSIKRHKNRSSEDAKEIQERWNAKKERDKQTKLVAENVLKVAQQWSEVDYSTLEQLIYDNNLTKMNGETKKVAQAIKTMKDEEKALSDIIPDVHKWHDQFSLTELKKVKEAVIDKLDYWDKYSDISIIKDPQTLKKKLDFEITWIENKKKYSTWEMAKAAYGKQLSIVEDKLWWNDNSAEANTLLAKITSVNSKIGSKWKGEIEWAIKNNNKAHLTTCITKLDKWDKIMDLETSLSGAAEVKDLTKFIKEGKLNKAWSEYQNLQSNSGLFNSYIGRSLSNLYNSGNPFSTSELKKIANFEKQIIDSLMTSGHISSSINDDYMDYILKLSEKYYLDQKSIYSSVEQSKMKKSAEKYISRPSINPNYVWGTDVGGVYGSPYKRTNYLPNLGFGITSDELSIVQRFTNGSTFSNAYNLRNSSPYWKKKWESKMAMLSSSQAKEMEQIIEEWSQGANYTLDRMVRYNGITFRGLDSGGGPELRSQLLNAFNIKKPWVNEASCSTSMKYSVSKSFNGDVILIIHNKTGAYIHPISDYSTEYEIMTLRGTKYNVIKPPTLVNGRYFVELEEI